MKKLSLTIVSFLLFLGISFGQDTNTDSHDVTFHVDPYAVLDIESATGNKTIDFTPSQNAEAGLAIGLDGMLNSDLWLNYSSIVSPSKTRTISAQMSNANLPAGVTLKVIAATATSSAKRGNVGSGGTSVQSFDATGATALTVVSGIGSCITGDGANNGCQLTYSVTFDDTQYASLEEKTYGATITYTISDQN